MEGSGMSDRKSTIKYLAVKLVELILTLLLVSFMTFAAFSVIPGDAASVMLGSDATPEQISSLRAELGLDRPMAEQYFSWLGGMITGDMGRSVSFGTDVSTLIGERMPLRWDFPFSRLSWS